MRALSKSFNNKNALFSHQEIETFLDAARGGDLETIAQMLDTYGKSIIEARDNDGNTALIWAAWEGHIEVVSALLDKGAKIEAKDDDGNTALILAACDGHAAVVSALLDKGAKIEAKDDDGNTALIWAAWGGKTAVVAALLDKNANIKAKNKNGNTALKEAVRKGHTEVEALIDTWDEQRTQKQAAERASELAAEIQTLHSGIHQEVKVGSRLVLQTPATGRKP